MSFRENWLLPLRDDVGNALGALFAASTPGTYRLHTAGELTDDTFRVDGDSSAQYALRGAAGAAPVGALGGLAYTARVLPAGTPSSVDNLELTATYAPDHPVFRGGGQLDRDNLLAEQRTNLCQTLVITVDELTVAAPPPVKAGTSAEFQTPTAPIGIDIAPPPNPALVTGALRIMNLGGRLGRLQVLAPAAVTADVDFAVTLRFGTDPDPDATRHKSIPITIRITPA